MKIVALNGSPKPTGNTSAAVDMMLDELSKQGFKTEHIQMYGGIITPCNDCGSCSIRGDGRCIIENDDMNKYLDKLVKADGIIMAAPSFYGGIPGQMKLLFERIGYAASAHIHGNKLARKVGAAVAVQSRDGGTGAYTQMVRFMLRNEMVVCGSHPLTIFTGPDADGITGDKEGVTALKDLAKQMGWLITKTRS